MNGIGMPTYTAESWEQLRAAADDRHTLGTLQEYEQKAARLARRFEAQGYRIEWVLFVVDDMVRWCRREGYRIDQRGRAAYGACLLASVSGLGGGHEL